MATSLGHSNWRTCRWAAVGVFATFVLGCAMNSSDELDLSGLRDDRVAEIEQRLSRDKPIVPNPFRQADSP